MSSILTRLLEKGLPTRDVQIATTGEQQQRPFKFEGAQEGNLYNADLLVVGGLDNGGIARHLDLDQQGRMIISGQAANGTGGPIAPVYVHGQNAEATNATAHPVLIAGRYDAAPRALTDGQQGALAVNSEGKLMIDLQNASLTATVNVDIDESTDSIQLYANDSTANRAVRSDASGRLLISGAAATGNTAAGNPVLVAGADGTGAARTVTTNTLGMVSVCSQFKAGDAQAGDVYPVLIGAVDENGNTAQVTVNQNGNLMVTGPSDEGESAWSKPLLIGGSDGEFITKIKTDTTGRQIIVGPTAHSNAVTGNPVLVGGSDGSATYRFKTDSQGVQVVRQAPDYTFYMHGEASGTGAQLVLTPNSGVYTVATFDSPELNFPTRFIIVSDNANNSYGFGTGLETITIEGFTTSGGLFVSEVIQLNGTTPVVTTNVYNAILRATSFTGTIFAGSRVTVRPNNNDTTLSYLEITDSDVYNPVFFGVNCLCFATYICISTDTPSTFAFWRVNAATNSKMVAWRRKFQAEKDFSMEFGPTGAFKVLNNEYIVLLNEGLTNGNTSFTVRYDCYKI